MTKRKYCINCEQYVTKTRGMQLSILVLFLLFFIVPGIFYFFFMLGKGGMCPLCGSKNWGKPDK